MDKQQSTKYQDRLAAANNEPRFLIFLEDYIKVVWKNKKPTVADINRAKKQLLNGS